VQLFACLDTVNPHGGGTMVVAGSHLLLNEGRFIPARELRRLLCREDFFRALFSEAKDSGDERVRWLNRLGAAHPAALEVVELTGAPGDAWLVDMRVLHAGAPNALDRPRIMATHRFVPEAVVTELGAAYNWT
jgi:ectoine hydroxylase-related dioxygenase (phytanoyl-CoA dioxygenase family)